jgi:hypothetical protein
MAAEREALLESKLPTDEWHENRRLFRRVDRERRFAGLLEAVELAFEKGGAGEVVRALLQA